MRTLYGTILAVAALSCFAREPNYDTSLIGRHLGYVRRGGEHGQGGYEWEWLLDFADGCLPAK